MSEVRQIALLHVNAGKVAEVKETLKELISSVKSTVGGKAEILAAFIESEGNPLVVLSQKFENESVFSDFQNKSGLDELKKAALEKQLFTQPPTFYRVQDIIA